MTKEQKPGTQPPAESEGKPPEYLSERALTTLRVAAWAQEVENARRVSYTDT